MSSQGYRNVAATLLRDAAWVLRRPPPNSTPPDGKDARRAWVVQWRYWIRERKRDVGFFKNPWRSAMWCEAAGLDYEAVLSRLSAEGLLYDASDVLPTALQPAA